MPVQGSDEKFKYAQRLLAWNTYQDSLRNADQKIMQQVQSTIANLRAALWVKAGTYIFQIIVVTGLFIIVSKQLLTSTAASNWAIVLSLASLVLLGILIYRNPLQSINRTLVDVARVQIILQGYQRQVSQVDAVFKQAILQEKIDADELTRSLDQIQKIIDANVESLLQFLEEMSA